MISRGTKGLAERYRPQRFSEMLGQEALTDGIRRRWSKQPRPTAIMLSGDTGTGKTTLARIIALALNCPHQELFGEPCKACRAAREDFEIREINAADLRGADDIRPAISDYKYSPIPPALVRVFILDECHALSRTAQNMLLKPFEDGPISTVWIICTTNAQGVIKTLRGRCVHWVIPPLKLGQTKVLVEEVIEKEISKGLAKKISSELIEKFIDALNEQSVFEPRLILQNLEKFLMTQDPKCVAGMEQEESVMLGRYVLSGDWAGVRARCSDLDASQLEGIRRGIIGYMKAALISSRQGQQATSLSQSIKELALATTYDDSMTAGLVIASLYNACRRFERK